MPQCPLNVIWNPHRWKTKPFIVLQSIKISNWWLGFRTSQLGNQQLCYYDWPSFPRIMRMSFFLQGWFKNLMWQFVFFIRYKSPWQSSYIEACENGCHFVVSILKFIFLIENCGILILISLSVKFVFKGPTNNKPAFVLTNGCQQEGYKPIIWTNDGLAYWHTLMHYWTFYMNKHVKHVLTSLNFAWTHLP